MQNTEYLGLKKPESTDFYNVDDFNENFDTIDSRFKNLSNVDNTADFEKPMSNPQKVYVENLKDQIEKDIQDVARVTELALNKTTTHLSAKDNPHGIDKEDVGLGNVDNTADMDKPVSTATQKALEEFESKGKITDTATGEHITVTNSTGASVREFKVDGRTEQFTTTGKNLLENIAVDKTTYGLTFKVNDDRSVTVNGTAEENIYYEIGNCENLSQDTNYVLTGCPNNGSQSTYMLYVSSTKTNIYDIGKGFAFSNENGKVLIKIGKGTKVDNLTFYPMIRLASTEDATYEPYTGGTASPNSDYPQDIKGVGNSGEVEVTVTGNNLFDGVIENGGIYATNGEPYSKNTITRSSNFIKVEPNEKYSVVRESTGASLYFWVIGYDENKNPITDAPYSATFKAGLYPMSGNTTQGDFITSPTTHYVKWADESSNDLTQKVIIKKCDGDYTYEPYKSQIVKIPVEPLIDPSPLYKGDYARLKDKNVEIVKNNKIVVFDGSDDEQWEYFYFTGINQFFLPCNEAKFVSDTNEIHVYSEQFRGIAENDRVDNYETIYTMTNGGNNRICINTKRAYSVEEWKTWLSQNPITVVYELTEPYTETMAIDIDLFTYSNVTNITNSDGANMEVEYFTNSANGEVIVDLQEEIKRLDNEKAGISLLHDYVIVDHINTLNIIVDAKCGAGDTFSVDRSGYVPLMATCKVINGANVICVSCSVKYVQGTGYVVESDFLNIGETTETVDAEITILYVRNI